MRFVNKFSDDASVMGVLSQGQNWLWIKIQPRLNRIEKHNFHTTNTSFHSIAWPATSDWFTPRISK